LRMVRDVGSALEFMHEREIVHMDVKPGNVLIGGGEGGREGGFKLADLGHAIKADGSMTVAEGDERCVAFNLTHIHFVCLLGLCV